MGGARKGVPPVSAGEVISLPWMDRGISGRGLSFGPVPEMLKGRADAVGGGARE